MKTKYMPLILIQILPHEEWTEKSHNFTSSWLEGAVSNQFSLSNQIDDRHFQNSSLALRHSHLKVSMLQFSSLVRRVDFVLPVFCYSLTFGSKHLLSVFGLNDRKHKEQRLLADKVVINSLLVLS